MASHPAKVLVDHCAIENGRTTRLVGVTETVTWGTKRVQVKVARIQGKRLQKNEEWLRNERRSLATVAAAARNGLITVHTSLELVAERLRARSTGRGIRGDLWIAVRFEHAPAPLDRSTWMGSLSLQQMASKEHREEFYSQMLALAHHGVPQQLLDALPTTEFVERQKANLSRLREYASLCDVVGSKRRGDAFHYWTAICNNLDYFLTTDKRFVEGLRKHSNKDLIGRAVTPSELVRVLHLPPTTLPIAEGEITPFATE